LNFESTVGGKPVGWRHIVERFDPGPTRVGWVVIYNRGWSWRTRIVPTSFTYTPPNGGAYRYRATVTNPVGYPEPTRYSSFNGGNSIAPGFCRPACGTGPEE
jgi:hypothetical protein